MVLHRDRLALYRPQADVRDILEFNCKHLNTGVALLDGAALLESYLVQFELAPLPNGWDQSKVANQLTMALEGEGATSLRPASRQASEHRAAISSVVEEIQKTTANGSNERPTQQNVVEAQQVLKCIHPRSETHRPYPSFEPTQASSWSS